MATRPAGVTLSEHESKALVARYGVPVPREALAADAAGAAAAAEAIGFPVVAEALRRRHRAQDRARSRPARTRRRRRRARGGRRAARRSRAPRTAPSQLLVAEQVRGRRELIAGLVRDPQFGPCVVLGLGGIFTEALGDVVFAAAPLGTGEALRADRRPAHAGAARPLPRRAGGRPRRAGAAPRRSRPPRPGARPTSQRRPEPADRARRPARRGRRARRARPVVRAAGRGAGARSVDPATRCARASARSSIRAASSSPACRAIPGKFGFAAFHNLLRFGYRGAVFPREPRRRRGARTARRCATSPRCRRAPPTWSSCARRRRRTPALLRACAARGVRAAFVASGGYGESGREGKALEAELVADGERVRHAARRTERPGPRVDRRRPVRTDRRALPAARPHLGGEPERQPVLRAAQLRRADRASASARRSRAATRRRRRSPTTSTTSPPTPRPPSRSPTSRASATGARSSTRSAASPPRSRSSC